MRLSIQYAYNTLFYTEMTGNSMIRNILTFQIFSRNIFVASFMCGQRHCSPAPKFCLKRALLVSKMTRYELECLRYPDLSTSKREAALRKQCFDYDVLLQHHNLHKEFEHKVMKTLNDCGIETRTVNRSQYTQSNIDWADIIIPTGGDGTFLMAASRVHGNEKPVVGLNSDPSRSEGYLCLPVKYSANIKEAVDKLLKGEFEWLFRSRIRITLHGENLCSTPIELHEHVISPSYSDIERKEDSMPTATENVTSEIVPVLALNEVYMGESLSSRVSYFGLSLDNGVWTKVKSSGLCVSTGTGSTSWHLSINRITEQSVAEVMKLLGASQSDSVLVKKVTDEFNKSLIFSCDKRMSYTIRDLISAGVWPDPKGLEPRGYANRIEVKSRCFDGGLVVDGGVFFKFNEGTTATLEVHDCDALRTVKLTE
ncbi:NAD kinase 2, mitochondrial isoform X2 [Periplaneta americana]|uniref:NAD kinase 2, mitochondrial isoform X2 n=1 Tax=Periplaneta americana TaxID=6978 RepID=UPI0037E8DF84